MGDGSLSQDEIDALLKGTDDVMPASAPSPVPAAPAPGGGGMLSPNQRSSLADMMNSVMAAVAPTLGGYLTKDLSITGASVEAKDGSQIAGELVGDFVQVQMGFNGGATGQNLVVMSMRMQVLLPHL
jgi:flagellar motor switch protein FliN/FliY